MGGLLFPELFQKKTSDNIPALVFPFHLHFENENIDYYFLVERDPQGGFLRISIEREQESRLNLSGINHVVVDDLDRRNYLQGLSRFIESLHPGLLREGENDRLEYTEVERRHENLFRQIQNAGLLELESITVRWNSTSSSWLFDNRDFQIFLKKAFLILEDRDILKNLKNGQTVEVISGSRQAYLDISRLNRCLNVSLGYIRNKPGMDHYLERMPRLKALSEEKENCFSGYRIFLIHHITSEILGTIAALNSMGCEKLSVLFVKYAGIVPDSYLEFLLSLDPDRFQFHGLQKITSESSIEGYYIPSHQYSQYGNLNELKEILTENKLGFFDAMRKTAMTD